MKPLGNSTKHFWLAQRMAKKGDADLVAAFERGELSQEEWAGMVTRCRSCDWSKGCERFLAQGGPTDTLPEQCLNRERFAELKSDNREVH